MNKKKNFFLILFGYLISLFLLYITFKDVNFDKVFNYLSKINLLMVFFAIILNIFFVWVRGIYQKNNLYLTTPNIKLNTSIISVGIALFYNVILPTRLGDIVRAIFISLKDNIKKKRILPYILIEKIIDFLLMIVLFFIIYNFNNSNSYLNFCFIY